MNDNFNEANAQSIRDIERARAKRRADNAAQRAAKRIAADFDAAFYGIVAAMDSAHVERVTLHGDAHESRSERIK